MRNIGIVRVIVLALAAMIGTAGCGGKTGEKSLKDETIATANGDAVKVRELREFLGIPDGVIRAGEVPAEKKKEALDRLIAGRLIAQEARAKGLDNTDAFRQAIDQGGPTILITALFRRELEALKIPEGEVREQVKKLRAADNTLSEESAGARAERMIVESGVRKIESDMIAAARKDFPVSIDQEKINRISGGQKMGDAEILAAAGGEQITYGQAKAMLRKIAGGTHGGGDLLKNPIAIGKVIEREVTGRALAAYAKKQGIEGTEYAKRVRRDMERSVLIDLIADKVVSDGARVTDKEIQAAYAEHNEMFIRDGKKIPLASVKDRIREFLQNEKKRKSLEAYVNGLRGKAKITVEEALLPKV